MARNDVEHIWLGKGTKKGNRTFFNGLQVQSSSTTLVVRVGMAVLLKPPCGNLAYVARVEAFYETPTGRKMMTTQWFYRHDDLADLKRHHDLKVRGGWG